MFSKFPSNEPASDFMPKSPFRVELDAEIKLAKENVQKIPLVINGKKIYNTACNLWKMPSQLSTTLLEYSSANEEQIKTAILGSLEAKAYWERTTFTERSQIFLKAAHLLSTKYRAKMLAATMLGQAKTAFQADIDAVAELIDFLKFNVHFAKQIYNSVELIQPDGINNSVSFRALEGFVAAISPFNFTAIGGNLTTAPCIVGNVVLWKPSNEALLSSYLFYEILLESGLPAGVIQFLPSEGRIFGDVITNDPNLAAINFTGSTRSFEHLFKAVGNNISLYRSFPKMIGETGGKNFHLLHETADVDLSVNCTIRSAFEYNGQKCSACSRLYVPASLWDSFKEKLLKQMKDVKMGQPDDYKSFLSSVISKKSFDNIKSYIDLVKGDDSLTLLFGGKCDENVGYFVQPTIIQTKNKNHKLLKEEIFGPVLCVYVYSCDEWPEILNHIDSVTPYSLTGSIFAKDRKVISFVEDRLLHTCGNIYINDKSTGAVVAQQPFGGARKSGTNDKAGMYTYLLRFVSPKSRKENHNSSSDLLYPYMK